VRELRR